MFEERLKLSAAALKNRKLGLARSATLALGLLGLLGACGDAGDAQFNAQQVQQIDAAVADGLAAFGGASAVPGAMLVIQAPGKGTLVKAYGKADIPSGRAMAAEDKFRVGSTTKTFVVTVLLQLVDEKKLGLDDPLSKFNLGVAVPNAANITLRQLCNMTSGLFEVYDMPELDGLDMRPDAKVDPRTLIALAVAKPVYFAPGQGWHYSNTGYLLLGLVIEAVTGRAAGSEIEARLLRPLKLSNTSFPSSPAMPTPYSRGYTLQADRSWQDQTVLLPPGAIWTAGVMVSDAGDMRRWVEAYVRGVTNSAATQAQRLECVETGTAGLRFGLGIGCSGGWYGYTGGIPGYNTAAYHLPGVGATIVVLVNTQQESPKPGVANAILRDITKVLYPANVAYSGKN